MPNNNITNQLTSNYLQIVQEINLKIEDSTNKAKATFDIFIKKEAFKNYDIEVNRTNFLINEKEIENKFSSVSNHYFSCLFPIQFKINEENKLVVTNFDDIDSRIKLKDLFFSESMDGEGLKHIRDQFFEQTSTNEKIQSLISSLAIIRIIELSLERYTQNPAMKVSWVVPIISNTHWETQIKKDNQNNRISFFSENTDKKIVLENLEKYCKEQELNSVFDNQESEIFATFETTINYIPNLVTIKDSQTQVNIKIGDLFEYQEITTLVSTIDE
jgi:hypothetical protein